LNWYRFIGRVLGKALYEGLLVDVAFAGFFLAKWLGKQSYLDDLVTLDPELYNGLVYLKNVEGTIDHLALNFAITHDGEHVSIASDCPDTEPLIQNMV
jgi:ubiquitin-protein ligase E3 C